MPLAWRLPNVRWPRSSTSPTTRLSITIPMSFGRRLSDGGISHEVCSLAGTLGLGKLIGFYDHNGISIDGETEGWFTDDTAKRFEAYHWHVVHEIDGHDPEAVKKRFRKRRA